jgi:hypothetical protein
MNKKFHLGIIFFCSLAVISIYANEAEKTDHSKNAQDLPQLKYEEGDITIDLKIEAERLKKTFNYLFKIYKNHILNSSKDNLIIDIEQSRKISENHFLNGNFKESRRSYRKGFMLFNQFTKDQSIYYKQRFKDNIEYLNAEILKLKNQSSPNSLRKIETSEKKIREAMLLNHLANNNFISEKYDQSFELYKSANLELLESIILVDKELILNPAADSIGNSDTTTPSITTSTDSQNSKESNKSINSDESPKKLLDEDYLNMASKKDWDDIHGKNHKLEETRREIERNKIKEFLATKTSNNNSQAKPTKSNETIKNSDANKEKEAVKDGGTSQ